MTRRPDAPAISVGGIVETYAVDGMARTGKWPAWFAPRMIDTHYRGTVPQRLLQAVNARKLELARRAMEDE